MKRVTANLIVLSVLGLAAVETLQPPVSSASSSAPAGLFGLSYMSTPAYPIGYAGEIKDEAPDWARAALAPADARFASIATASVISADSVDDGCAVLDGRVMCWGRPARGSVDPTSISVSGVQVMDAVDVVYASHSADAYGAAGWIACASRTTSVICADSSVLGDWRSILNRSVDKVVATTRRVCILEQKSVSCATLGESLGQWVPVGNRGAVVDLALRRGTICIAETTQLKCEEQGRFADPAEFKNVSGPSSFEKVWLLDSGFQGILRVCAHAQDLLWCDSMTRGTNGLTYELFPTTHTRNPRAVLTVPSFGSGLDPEVTRTFFGRIVVLDENGLSHVVGPDTRRLGFDRGGAPISTVWGPDKGAIARVIGPSGSTNSLALVPMKFKPGANGVMRSRQLIFTSDGQPLVGAKIRWVSTNVAGLGGHDPNKTYRTDDSGRLSIELPTSDVTFTVSEARLTDSTVLEAATVTVDISDDEVVKIEVAPPPTTRDVSIEVVLPDGTPVPNAVVSLKNPFLVYGYTKSEKSIAAWAARRLDDSMWLFPVTCVWCVQSESPLFLTGADGRLQLRVFNGDAKPTAVDAVAAYYDGEILQSTTFTIEQTNVKVQLPYMAKIILRNTDIEPETSDVDINVDSQGQAILEAELEDWSSTGELGDVMIEPVCELMEEGGAYDPSSDISELCQVEINRYKVTSSAVRIGGQSLSAKSGFSCGRNKSARLKTGGVTKLRVCTSKSQRIRVRTGGALPTRIVCVRVKREPCKRSLATRNADESPAVVRRRASMGVSMFLSEVGTSAKKSRVVVTGSGACSVVNGLLKAARKAGLCQILIWRDKSKSKLVGRVDLIVR